MFQIKTKLDYTQQYQASVANPEKFWQEISDEFFWFKKPQKISNCDLKKAQIKWFEDGETNLAYNCLDRHLAQRGDQVALIWEGNDPSDETQKITYRELHQKTCQLANLLEAQGIKKGDRVCIYMPMIPEALVAMLACARIGAVHCVVFAGFSAKALAQRINDAGAKMLITADLLFRGDKKIELFEIAKEALAECEAVESALVYQRQENVPEKNLSQKIILWKSEIEKHQTTHQAAQVAAEDPLFILYTSGSTGKPKGILHTTGGYMTYAGYSFANVFQYRQGEVFFCTADIGWITGHSYLAYGPLLNGATILMFEGIPTHPTPARFWEVIDKHRVNIFYTAPTAIRALMQRGNEFLEGRDLSSLRVLGTVGEPINEEAWQWYFEKIGKKKCAIVDTWWQTETGGILISSFAGVLDSKPAHAGFPLPGILPVLVDDAGKEIAEANKVGNLCLVQAWPGMARGVWGDEEKFKSYFKTFFAQPSFLDATASENLVTRSSKPVASRMTDERVYYLAGDGALKNSDGLYRIIGRTDDVIKVSGHRLGTAEIENAANQHAAISESAAIGVPHEIKGEGIYVFAILHSSHVEAVAQKEKIAAEISQLIRKEIGAIAAPEKIFIVGDLPKTRSGKIMRRILKKIIAGEKDLGDVSTLVNPDCVNQLQKLCS